MIPMPASVITVGKGLYNNGRQFVALNRRAESMSEFLHYQVPQQVIR
jgi:hypothetical protein